MTELNICGNIYDVEVGKEFTIDDPDQVFGSWITVTTSDYELTATKISFKDNKDTFIVDKIKFFNGDTNEIISEEVEYEDGEEIDLSSLKKPELIKIAKDMGIFVSSRNTKKELIEMIKEQ